MVGTRSLLFVALLLSASALTAQPSIDFHFTYEAAILRGAAAATTEWTTQCVAGGEFAGVAGSLAPDPRGARRRAHGTGRDVMGGITAVTAGRGRITLRIHPDADWRKVLPYALAHEMHHSYWAQHHYDPARPFTLADYLVLEGRADYFAGTLFTHSAPWTAALDAAAYTAAWQALSKQLNATDWAMLQAAMFGAPQAGIPRWAGYSIGYRLVSERMARAPRLNLKAMSAAPASEFIPPPSGR